MSNEDQACYFGNCPRCKERGWERFSTHAYCVNCNHEVIYSDELCAIPQWAIQTLKNAKPKSIVRELRPKEMEYILESAAV